MAESIEADQHEIAEALATADLAPGRHRGETFSPGQPPLNSEPGSGREGGGLPPGGGGATRPPLY